MVGFVVAVGIGVKLAVASVGCGLCRGLRKMERVGERDRGRVRNNNKKSNKNIKERIFK